MVLAASGKEAEAKRSTLMVSAASLKEPAPPLLAQVVKADEAERPAGAHFQVRQNQAVVREESAAQAMHCGWAIPQAHGSPLEVSESLISDRDRRWSRVQLP